MFASIHAWLIYIRVAQDRAIACELPGQLMEDVLDKVFFIFQLCFSLSILFIDSSGFKLTVNTTPVYFT